MLQRTLNFLQAVFHELLPAPFSITEQAMQAMVNEQDTPILPAMSTMKKDLIDTGGVPAVPVSAQERITEPYRALMRLKHPELRYRDLDALLEHCKRERLNNVDTRLELKAVYRPVRRLQPIVEREKRR
jgi:hypothetical protein